MRGEHPAIDEVGDELAQAFEFITQLRIRHQAEQLEAGKPLDNFINPGMMTSMEKRSLRAAFLAIARVQDNIMDLLRSGPSFTAWPLVRSACPQLLCTMPGLPSLLQK